MLNKDSIYSIMLSASPPTVICLLFIHAIDRFIQYIGKNGRWFQLHAVINMSITALTFHDVKDCIFNPAMSYGRIDVQLAGYLALALHIYHCLMFKIRLEDWVHHILSVFITTPIFIYNPCRGTSVFLFVATGLPGAIDYSSLVLYKNGMIRKYTQKNITSTINSYIRMPGGAICSYLLFKDAFYERINASLLLLSFIIYTNTVFYGKQSIESFQKYKVGDLL